MALPNTPVGYDSWNSYIEINAPALAASQGITLQQAKASLKLLNVSEPIRGAVGEPYYREYNVFTTWADRALLPEPGRPWKLAPSFTVLSLFAQGEQGAWYDPSDLTTMYQTSTGTTPVTAAGQQVGLLLDKSQGLVLGPELVTNGDFSSGTTTGWTAGAPTGGVTTLVVASGELSVSNSTANSGYAIQGVSTTVGKWYRATCVARVGVGNGASLRATNDSNGTGTGQLAISTTTSTSNTTLTVTFLASQATTYLVMIAGPTTAPTSYFDNVSVKLLPGNHATQATSAQRPTLGRNPVTGTRNLLTYTEQFDNAAWTKVLSASVSANSEPSPIGDLTADTFVAGAANSALRQTVTLEAIPYTYSVWLKRKTGTGDVQISVTGGAWTTRAVTNDWTRFSITQTPVAGSNFPGIRMVTSGDEVYVWGAQLETGSTATAYQRVVSAFDVTQAGVADAWYLSCDGTDDGMVTNTITPGIDKAQVFAGVRKLSDAASGIIAETSTNINTNANSLYLSAPNANAANNYGFAARGSAGLSPAVIANATAPSTSVVTGISDIQTDLRTIRINGSIAESVNAPDQGTGNYLAYPLYIGRRGGTTLPFNGRIYSMIVRFGANLTQQQILDTETWVGEKTGINIPLWVSPTVYDSSNNPVLDRFNQTIELY